MRAPCIAWSSGWASATAICKRARFASTPTYRCAPRARPNSAPAANVKNLNSFRYPRARHSYEVRRQIELIEDGGTVLQETRLYDSDRDETRSMRSKEDADDYRYFPDPDLPPLVIAPEWIERVKAAMPELPAHKRARFESELGLTGYDAAQLTMDRAVSSYFEELAAQLPERPGQTCRQLGSGRAFRRTEPRRTRTSAKARSRRDNWPR